MGVTGMAKGPSQAALAQGDRWRAETDHPAVQHQYVGSVVIGRVPVVGDHHDRRPVLALKSLDHPVHVGFTQGVHPGCGFVEQKEPGLANEGPGQVEALELTARKPRQGAVSEVRPLDLTEGSQRLLALARGHPERPSLPQPAHHQLNPERRERTVQGFELGNKTKPLRGHLLDRPAKQADPAPAGADEAQDHPQKRALPCPVRADHGNERPLGYGKAHLVERHVPPVTDFHFPKLDGRLHGPSIGDLRLTGRENRSMMKMHQQGGRFMQEHDPILPQVKAWRARAAREPESFWAQAAEGLEWFAPWKTVFRWEGPRFSWFEGGITNLAANALDRHVRRGQGGRAALVFLNEAGEERTFTYARLLDLVSTASSALRGLGVKKGDRITLYMPPIPEAIILMLAATRIGAIHSVVFAGFGTGALHARIKASGSKYVFTADVTYRRGQPVPLKPIVDEALEGLEDLVERVVVVTREKKTAANRGPRDMTWDEFLAQAGPSGDAQPMEANEPAFILATSGTTGRPKLVVHTHGGYAVGIQAAARWIYDLRPEDVWWATSDIGWIVGHSYIVYAPLLIGATTIAYEGAYDHPGPDVFWKVIERYRVSGVFTSPTLIRMLMKHGTEAARGFDLSSVRRVFSAGEVLNPPAWAWLQGEVFRDEVPVLDHWWQTETGGPVIANPYGVATLPIRPGAAGLPLAGIDVAVVDADGNELPPGKKGILVIKRPFPHLTPTLWGEPERYHETYWNRIPGKRLYFTGDAAMIDEDGYVHFAGRADEVIKVAAHRIGTIEVENAFLKHPAVAEAGVTGRPDPIRGEVIAAFVVLKPGHEPSEALKGELLQTVRRELGPVAVIGDLFFVKSLPKTRSGKIMRRVLRAIVTEQDPGDMSTIEEQGSVTEIQSAYRAQKHDPA